METKNGMPLIRKSPLKRKRGELSQQILSSITPEQYARTYKQMAIAACIADALEANGWNKGEFAARMNRQPSVITRWLSGTHNFTVETLLDIEQALGIQLILIATPKRPYKESSPVHY